MKRRNVFSFVFFVTLMFLLLACGGNGRPSIRQNWGELIVKNQTSKAIYHVSYCGKNIKYEGYTKIGRGEEANVTFLEGQTGYLFFSADRDNDVTRHLRTEDKIVLRVGETETYLLTNDTMIFDIDKMQTGTMSEFFAEAELKIQNKSAYRIDYVRYKATVFKGEHCYSINSYDSYISPGDSSTRVFYDLDEDEYSDYIYLLHNKKGCRVKEMVTIRKGKRTIFTITDDTPLQYEGRTVKLEDL